MFLSDIYLDVEGTSPKIKRVLTTLWLKRENMHKFFADGKVKPKKGKPVKIGQWNKK